MIKFLLSILFSCILSQGNYQILSCSSNFNDMLKVESQNQNKNYALFNASLPADINIFSGYINYNELFKKQLDYNLRLGYKSIDYGTLEDSQTNNQFKAHESAIEINLMKEEILEDTDLEITFGYLKSKIETYNSEAIYTNLKWILPLRSHDLLVFKLENFGSVIEHYTSSKIRLPKTVGLSYALSNTLPFDIFIGYENRMDLNDKTLHVTAILNVIENVKLYISSDSNRKELFYGDYVQELFAGLRFGLDYSNELNNFGFGLQNLGPAGNATFLSFSRKIK